MNRPRRIILLNRYFHPDHSATSRLASDLAFDLAACGWSVAVVTSQQSIDNPRQSAPAYESIDGVAIHRVRASRFGRARLVGRMIDYVSFLASAAFCLFWLLRRGDIVIVKTDPPLASVAAAAVTWARGASIIAWMQDLFPELAEALRVPLMHGVLVRWLKNLRNRSLRGAHAIVAVSEGMASRLAAEGLPRQKIVVIANWIDGRRVVPCAPDENRLRAAWGLSDSFVVGYSGSLGRAHDSETVLDAARRLRTMSGIRFLFIGGGSARANVERCVREQGLKQVQFEPYQAEERLAESLSVADAHLVTLRPEADGLVVPSKLAAACAAGRPVLFVGPRESDLAALVTGSGCGAAIAVGDGAALAEIIRAWARDRDRAQAHGRAARALFDAHFERRSALRRWHALLGERGGNRSSTDCGKQRVLGLFRAADLLAPEIAFFSQRRLNI